MAHMMNTFFVTLMLFLQPGCHTAKEIVLVENGKAHHKIVLPAEATPAEKRAAACGCVCL